MESVLELLAAVMVWRFLLSVGVSALIALFLSQLFADFTAGYCIALVFLGTVFGIVWHSRAEAGIALLAPVPATPVSKLVTFLGLLLIGFIFGGLLSELLRSPVLGAAALVSGVSVVGLCSCFARRRTVSISYLAFACSSLLAGLAAWLFLKALSA